MLRQAVSTRCIAGILMCVIRRAPVSLLSAMRGRGCRRRKNHQRNFRMPENSSTDLTDLEIAEEQLEEWQSACRKLERMNTDLRFALEAALPGLRDLVNQERPDPS